MIKSQKTIFITSFFGLIARNILATDFLQNLKNRKDVRVIILAPNQKVELYRKAFGGKNIIIEGIDNPPLSRIDKFISSFFQNLLDTKTKKIHRLVEKKNKKRYLRFFYHTILSKIFSRIKFFRLFFRWLDFNVSSKMVFNDYFEKYQPDVIFATDIFQPEDILLAREAKAKKVFTVGMIRSWDNITTKGLNRIIPNKLIVNTPKIKEEAIYYDDFKSENIHIIGIPHYDSYLRDERSSKEELFKKLGLDPSKKTIFFAPPSSIYSQKDSITQKIIKELAKLKHVQLLLRLYLVGNVNLGDVKPIFGKIAIDDPSAANFTEADLLEGDKHLADLLYHSDVMIAFASTLAIDAVLFNKPIIFVSFDGDENRPYWKSLRRFYDYDHQQSIIKTGGVKSAKSMDELMEYAKIYLDNPKQDEEKREKIIRERIWKLDAKSGERLTEVMNKYI